METAKFSPENQALGPLGTGETGLAGPDYRTVCRHQKTLQAQLSDCPSAEPLQLLVDSTGVEFLGEGEWNRKKHDAEYHREWRNVHPGINAQTLEICAVEVPSNAIGDAPMLEHISQDEALANVTADGAYHTRACRDAIAQRGVVAVIAPRKNARLWHQPNPGSESRNEPVWACQRLGHAIWKAWSGYHWRSLVDTECTA